MKKLYRKIIFILVLILMSSCFLACTNNKITDDYSLIRIHIRANSNDEFDQAVKLLVRDEITLYLEKELYGITDFAKAYSELSLRLKNIETIANNVLEKNGLSYKSEAKLNNEFFPTRSYENIIVESGYYDALIISLGDANGTNWWCVIYPPLCYLEAEGKGDFAYKSKIKEIWDNYIG